MTNGGFLVVPLHPTPHTLHPPFTHLLIELIRIGVHPFHVTLLIIQMADAAGAWYSVTPIWWDLGIVTSPMNSTAFKLEEERAAYQQSKDRVTMHLHPLQNYFCSRNLISLAGIASVMSREVMASGLPLFWLAAWMQHVLQLELEPGHLLGTSHLAFDQSSGNNS